MNIFYAISKILVGVMNRWTSIITKDDDNKRFKQKKFAYNNINPDDFQDYDEESDDGE